MMVYMSSFTRYDGVHVSTTRYDVLVMSVLHDMMSYMAVLQMGWAKYHMETDPIRITILKSRLRLRNTIL